MFPCVTTSENSYFERLAILLLLLIDYAKPEVYFVGLVEVRLHLHDLGEGLFGVVQRAVAVIQNAYAIPQSGFLLTSQYWPCELDSKLHSGCKPTLGFGRLTSADW